jgi:hypothetical protein
MRCLGFAVVLASLACPTIPASAAVALKCEVRNDTWTVTGAVGRHGTCSVTCLFRTPQGDADRVTCSFTASGSPTQQPFCEGSQVGRVWTSALTLTQQCAYSD